MSDGPIKLGAIRNPELVIETPSNEKRTYDLYELSDKLGRVVAIPTPDGGLDMQPYYDGIRAAFGFPTDAEVAAAREAAGQPREANMAEPAIPFTLSRAMCENLKTIVSERMAELPERKRFFALLQKFSTITNSSQAS